MIGRTQNHTVPYGTALLGWRCPRHFVPGYDRTVTSLESLGCFALFFAIFALFLDRHSPGDVGRHIRKEGTK